jgi:hypothetical protein
MTEVWVTKWALTDGVIKTSSATIWKSCSGTSYFDVPGRSLLKQDVEAFDQRERAVKRIAEMRDRRISFLRKQIAKLEALDPEKVVPP